MGSYPYAVRTALACAVFVVCASARPARAQIAMLVDEQGHKIFVNQAEAPVPSKQFTESSTSSVPGKFSAPPAAISQLVENTADRMQVDPKLVQAVIQVESGYNPRAVSSKGARGLMQLMPATAERFGVQNSFNPRQNIEGGVTYLRYLLDLFGGNVPLSVAAYNAGEHDVQRNGGIPPYAETVHYVQRVTRLYGSQGVVASPQKPAIYRTVDEHGVVHYTNDGS